MEEQKPKKTDADIAGIVCAGCMFVGAGIGMSLNVMMIGGCIGLGVGLIAMAVILNQYRKKED